MCANRSTKAQKANFCEIVLVGESVLRGPEPMEFVSGSVLGGMAPTPVLFGKYEVGRTSDPSVTHRPSASFMADGGRMPVDLEGQGDPGAYDPWVHDDHRRIYGFSKSPKPFDSTAFRDMSLKCAVKPPPTNCCEHQHASAQRSMQVAARSLKVFCAMSCAASGRLTRLPAPALTRCPRTTPVASPVRSSIVSEAHSARARSSARRRAHWTCLAWALTRRTWRPYIPTSATRAQTCAVVGLASTTLTPRRRGTWVPASMRSATARCTGKRRRPQRDQVASGQALAARASAR